MTAKTILRWIAVTALLVVFTAGGYTAARLTRADSASSTPTPAITVTAQAATATAQVATATAQVVATATPQQGNPIVNPPVPPAPRPVPPGPVPPGPVPPGPPSAPLAPVHVYYPAYNPVEPMAGICGYEILPFTYQVSDDPIISAVSFLRSEMGYADAVNLLYGLPLSIDDFGSMGDHVDIFLSADIPYTDTCNEAIIEAQLRATLSSFEGISTAIYINGLEIGEFFAQRYQAYEFPSDYPGDTPENSEGPIFDPGPHVPSVISGSLGYPADMNPALDIYAINANDPSDIHGITTAPDQNTFEIGDLYGGDYYIVAQLAGGDGSFVGSYTQASLCGLQVGCDDHSPIIVTVQPGETYYGVEITDWGIDPLSVPSLPKG